MKVLLLAFFYLASCAIQQESTESAFNNYSRIEPSISKEEFARIANFISRVEAAKDEEPVVREDFSILSTLGFTNILNAFHPPKSKNDETVSNFTCGDVNAFVDGLQTKENTPKTDLNVMTLAQVLKFNFCFESPWEGKNYSTYITFLTFYKLAQRIFVSFTWHLSSKTLVQCWMKMISTISKVKMKNSLKCS